MVRCRDSLDLLEHGRSERSHFWGGQLHGPVSLLGHQAYCEQQDD